MIFTAALLAFTAYRLAPRPLGPVASAEALAGRHRGSRRRPSDADQPISRAHTTTNPSGRLHSRVNQKQTNINNDTLVAKEKISLCYPLM